MSAASQSLTKSGRAFFNAGCNKMKGERERGREGELETVT